VSEDVAKAVTERSAAGRIETLDLLRGLALLAMAIYHFTWDLEFFGYAQAGMTAVGGWRLFARAIASSFLFIAGFSLVLAHGGVFRPASLMRRLRLVAGAAILITIVTWFAFPDGFIFFGILHQIAAASLIGLFFVRLPWLLTTLAALAVIAAPHFFRHHFFDTPVLWWVGLSTELPRSNDYVPIFPWTGAVLLGIAFARLALDSGWVARIAPVRFGNWSRPLQYAGRHSLAVYLIHQPALIALVFIASLIAPPQSMPRTEQFAATCRHQCTADNDEDFCTAYCDCALEHVVADGQLDAMFAPELDPAAQSYFQNVAALCTAQSNGR